MVYLKNSIYKPLSLAEYTLQKKYGYKSFLVPLGYVSKFSEFFGISVHVWRKEFLNDKFHSDLFIFLSVFFVLKVISSISLLFTIIKITVLSHKFYL